MSLTRAVGRLAKFPQGAALAQILGCPTRGASFEIFLEDGRGRDIGDLIKGVVGDRSGIGESGQVAVSRYLGDTVKGFVYGVGSVHLVEFPGRGKPRKGEARSAQRRACQLDQAWDEPRVDDSNIIHIQLDISAAPPPVLENGKNRWRIPWDGAEIDRARAESSVSRPGLS